MIIDLTFMFKIFSWTRWKSGPRVTVLGFVRTKTFRTDSSPRTWHGLLDSDDPTPTVILSDTTLVNCPTQLTLIFIILIFVFVSWQIWKTQQVKFINYKLQIYESYKYEKHSREIYWHLTDKFLLFFRQGNHCWKFCHILVQNILEERT